MILRHRKRLSSSWRLKVDPGRKFIEDCFTLERRTGRRNETMASCICSITFWLVEILSAINNSVLWNSYEIAVKAVPAVLTPRS